MSSNRDDLEDVPPIPSYDEAIAAGTAWRPDPTDDRPDREIESQSLLRSSHNQPGPSRHHRQAGYRAPTVETDDEDSEWTSEDDDETTQVRREIEQMEIEEADERSRSSIFGKRIPFSLSLPKWRWSWRPRLPRMRIRLPSRPGDGDGREPTREGAEEADTEGSSARSWRRWKLPKIDVRAVLLFVARILVLFMVMSFFYLLFFSDLMGGVARRMGSGVNPTLEDLRIYLHNHVEERRLRASVRHYTNYAHVAGTEGDYALARDVAEMFRRAGLQEVTMEQFNVYLNFPKTDGRSVEVLGKDGKATFKAKLEEPEVGKERQGTQTPAYHAHSKGGDVKGPLIYVNYGSVDDYRRLERSGIDTKGAIALVRAYGTEEDLALKVKGAELAGFAGCLVYTDPSDNGFRVGDVAPNGRFMPADGVQRGTVSLSRWVIGDVLTPGWASTKTADRIPKKAAIGLPGIPSLPLSSNDATALLRHLRGFGQKAPQEWVGGANDVGEWWTGNLSAPVVRLRNEQYEEERKPIWNVYGKIQGAEQSARSVILGNRRDSLALGATDPHSGTAILMEMARFFGDLRSKGWVPLRTIEFMSFDGGAYNMAGSTEYVESNEAGLRENAYAYINLDGAVAGTEFRAAGSPVFNRLLMRVLDRLWDPTHNTTMRDVWNRGREELRPLGHASDYVPFQAIAGTSSLEVSFGGHEMYPRGSHYDNFEWVEKVADPGYRYHRMMAEIVGMMTLELSDRYILPFDVSHYATQVEGYVKDLEAWSKRAAELEGQRRRRKRAPDEKEKKGKRKLDVKPLERAVKALKKAARDFAAWEMEWDSIVTTSGRWESNALNAMRQQYNDRMAQLETSLLDPRGIPDRTQFKHVLFGPSRWGNTSQSQFPAIRGLVEDGKWDEANALVRRTADIVTKAAKELRI